MDFGRLFAAQYTMMVSVDHEKLFVPAADFIENIPAAAGIHNRIVRGLDDQHRVGYIFQMMINPFHQFLQFITAADGIAEVINVRIFRIIFNEFHLPLVNVDFFEQCIPCDDGRREF